MTFRIIDIGQKLWKHRKQLGLTQMELAEKVGISFQQIQKYEKGMTNIPVTRLHQVAEALGVEVSTLFQGEGKAPQVSEPSVSYTAFQKEWLDMPTLFKKQEMTLLKLFRKINNKKVRDGVLRQLKGIVELEKRKSPKKNQAPKE